MIKWLKILIAGKKGLIRLMDELEQPLADKIREGQKKASDIPPEQFAKELVDACQLKLCKWMDVDPKEVGL